MTEIQYMRQYQRISQAVGNAVFTAQLVCYRMHVANVHLVDCQASIVSAHSHTVPGPEIAPVMKGSRQVVKNQFHCRIRASCKRVPRSRTPI